MTWTVKFRYDAEPYGSVPGPATYKSGLHGLPCTPSSFDTKPSVHWVNPAPPPQAPGSVLAMAGWGALPAIGKSGDAVVPATNTVPGAATAIDVARSSRL